MHFTRILFAYVPLSGEQLLSVALVVKRLLPLAGSNPVPSVMGRLECTNFCLRFTPDMTHSVGVSSDVLNDSRHIPLLTIGAVYKSVYSMYPCIQYRGICMCSGS